MNDSLLVIFRWSVMCKKAWAICSPVWQPSTFWNLIKSDHNLSFNFVPLVVSSSTPLIQCAFMVMNVDRFGSLHISMVNENLPFDCYLRCKYLGKCIAPVNVPPSPFPDHQGALIRPHLPSSKWWCEAWIIVLDKGVFIRNIECNIAGLWRCDRRGVIIYFFDCHCVTTRWRCRRLSNVVLNRWVLLTLYNISHYH